MDTIEVRGPQALLQIGPIVITQTIVSLVVVTALLVAAGILLGRNLQKRPGKTQVLTEKGIQLLTDLVVSTMGAHNVGWTPYIGTIFLSSICGTLVGMSGFLRSTTADLAVVLTWAVMTSGIIWYKSIKRSGFLGWLKGFTQPIAVMTPMNIVSEIAQPVALAFRHFGNVAGGGIITTILYTALALASSALLSAISASWFLPAALCILGLFLIYSGKWRRIFGIVLLIVGTLGLATYLEALGGVQIPILQLGIPAVLSIYFDLFSGFVQAFVFCLLSMVYIAGACPPTGEQT